MELENELQEAMDAEMESSPMEGASAAEGACLFLAGRMTAGWVHGDGHLVAQGGLHRLAQGGLNRLFNLQCRTDGVRAVCERVTLRLRLRLFEIREIVRRLASRQPNVRKVRKCRHVSLDRRRQASTF